MSKATATHNNKNELTDDQFDGAVNKHPKNNKNITLLAETPAYESNNFPRAASNALLAEQNSDEDNQPSDFSVEREILKKQLKKQREKNLDSNGHLKQCEIHHKNSESSMLDACEDCGEDEDQILRALKEIDDTKKID